MSPERLIRFATAIVHAVVAEVVSTLAAGRLDPHVLPIRREAHDSTAEAVAAV